MTFQHHSKAAVYVAFFIYAALLGSLFPRLGDIQIQMGITESILGLAITGLPVGLQLSLLYADRLLAKITFKTVIIYGLGFMGLSYGLAVWNAFSFADSSLGVWLFFASLLVAGLCIGIIEVAVNLEADRVEYATRSHIMNRAHAFWSLGFFATALIGASASQLGVSVFAHLSWLGAGIFIISVALYKNYAQAPKRLADTDETPLFVRPTKAVMVLVFLTLSAMLAEGAAIDWSVIFMRDIFASPPLTAGMALAFAAFFQFITRFNADRFVQKFGSASVAKSCLWLLLAGACCVVFSAHWGIALAGFALIGAGSSVIFPLAMSAAAQLTDRTSASNVASLAQIAFMIFLAAPPLLGFIAEHIGIRYSFALILPLTVLSFMNLSGLKANNSG